MRILLFTGKGGVGKTTTAAATALALADAGVSTLVMSADPAHSLGDAFDRLIPPEPVEVAPNCWAEQLDARERLEADWGDIRAFLLEVLDWAGVGAIEAEELAVLPGLEELFALLELHRIAEERLVDTIVVDCAPTAETMRLLSLPEVLGWYMERLFPLTRRINRVVGPVVSRLTNLPAAPDSVFAAGNRFHTELGAARRLLADPETTSVRLVVNPERMVLSEARRTWTYLSLFGYTVDGVVVNRVLPDVVADPFFDRWRTSQREHLGAVEESFPGLPILRAELQADEVFGLDRLRALADGLWADRDPRRLLSPRSPMRLESEGADVVLHLDLPHADRSELDLTRSGDEMYITLGPYRRSVVLPEALRRREVCRARFDDGQLVVHFGEPAAARPAEAPTHGERAR